MSNILELSHVVKAYQTTLAVDDVSFDMPKGSIFGLLGPNGAGKTSLIRIITSITRADSGRVLIDGVPLNIDHPEIIGYMPEERGLYKKMKVGEHLIYLARLKGLSANDANKAIDYWMDKFAIRDWWNKRVEELSKGMQQKIQFIATVIHKPKLIILDEPFSGLDPINSNLIKDEIHQLRDEGASIIFSTHRMEQVEEICERIVLINRGKNVLEGNVTDLRQARKKNLFRYEFSGELPSSMLDGQTIVEQNNGRIILHFPEEHLSNQFLSRLIQSGVYVRDFTEILPSLNEIFIRTVEEQGMTIDQHSNHEA
ncbi:MAG: ATP-binding cassette domain-containing protein [Saprospiraceae bacterium]|jgi:ABC-2 type transport system ATP-binding protein|nr:ATP-binding cassette domain-containing protein [Saprospiraceae bacterium]